MNSDGIAGQMLLLCDGSVILPLQIIFTNILSTSIYPNMWKLANVTSILKKGDTQLIKNYRQISLLPICGKILENNLITKNQSGFRPGDSKPINYCIFLMKSSRHLIVQHFLKLEQYFLIYLKHWTRYGMID